jgi:sulfite exporter TauE/SafE
MSAFGAGVELGAFFLVGLLGGAHCLGMCGPLVTTYTTGAGGTGGSDTGRGRVSLHDVRQQGLFTLGRITAYATLGAVFGALGDIFVTGGSLFAAVDLVRGSVGVLTGLVVLGIGVGYLRGRPLDPGGVAAVGVGSVFARTVGAIQSRATEWADGPRIALLGTLHSLLPCPLLYPAYLYAFARGSPVAGALALGTLGVGTAPALVGYATVIGAVPSGVRSQLHRALGAAFLLVGLVPLLHGLALLGLPVPTLHLPHYAEVPTP